MSKAGGVSNVELSTNLEKTCRMMSYHAVVRISYLVGRGSFRRKWMGGATAVQGNTLFDSAPLQDYTLFDSAPLQDHTQFDSAPMQGHNLFDSAPLQE